MHGLRRKYGAGTALAHLETCGEAHRPHRTLVVGLARYTVAEHLQVDLTEQRHGTADKQRRQRKRYMGEVIPQLRRFVLIPRVTTILQEELRVDDQHKLLVAHSTAHNACT